MTDKRRAYRMNCAKNELFGRIKADSNLLEFLEKLRQNSDDQFKDHVASLFDSFMVDNELQQLKI